MTETLHDRGSVKKNVENGELHGDYLKTKEAEFLGKKRKKAFTHPKICSDTCPFLQEVYLW